MQEKRFQITPRQLQVLKLLSTWQNSHCYSITLQELSGLLNLSRTTVYEHISGLRKKGLLTTEPNKARSLKLTAKALELLKTESSHQQQSTESIPLLGRIAAGVPIDAIEDTEQITLGSQFGTGDNIFALRVCGDSMTGDGIFDGDLVVCRKAPNANADVSDGQLVAAIVDGDTATVKRIYRDNGQARLEASNPAYEPIYAEDCRIAGIVVGLLRSI